MAGASWVQPIDGSTREAKVHPTVYYRYDTSKFRMSLGMFPRTQLIENVPAILQYDSLTYFRPNIAGALFQYIHAKGFAEALYRLETSTDRGKTRGFHGCIQRPVATPALPFRGRAFGDEPLGSSSQFG